MQARDDAQALERARRDFARGDYAGCVALCEAALARSPRDFDALLLLGSSLRRLGRLAEALARLEQARNARPDSIEAVYALGLAQLQANAPAHAIGWFDRAIAMRGGRLPDAAFNKGVALAQLGRYGEALACFREVRSAVPPSALVLYNEGEALGRLGRFEEELQCYDEALRLEPGSPALLVNRGVALNELGRHREALESLDQAIAAEPRLAEAHSNRSVALARLRRHEEALAASDAALVLKARYPEALANRGVALNGLGRHEQALEAFEQALRLRAGDVETLNNRGIALHQMRRPGEALQSYQRALAIAPGHVRSLCNRALALAELGERDAACAALERALELAPRDAGVLGNAANTYLEAERFEDALGCFERLVEIDPDHEHALGSVAFTRLQLCDWSGLDRIAARVEERLRTQSSCVHPFHLLALSDDPEAHLRAARRHAATHAAAATAAAATAPAAAPAARGPEERIRLAYVSADFHEHATAYLIAGLLQCHDRQRFEVTAVSFGPDDASPMRKRIRASVERFVDVRARSDRETVALLRSLAIDIAVDLKGYTRDARPRLFALRAAPVQVNYLGYPGSLGADCIGYVLADPVLVSAQDRGYFSEKIACLPGSYQATDRGRAIAATPSRAQAGLPEEGFVFASFNSPYKIGPGTFDVWMRLLAGKRSSVLWLIAGAAQRANLRNEAAKRGVDPGRLVFAPRLAASEHLARLRLADLCLDTFPYGGHTTTSDALWAGVPVLTRMGRSFASRVAASLLRAVGLDELVTRSAEDYERLGAALAREPEMLAGIRGKLEKQRLEYPLFDTPRFTRAIEAAYARMWQRHREGLAPEHFRVEG